MNNMTEEGLEGSGDCVICFNKIENYDVLPDQESQKIINNCWAYLYGKIANSKLQTAKSIDENQQPCCKKCFDAASELTKLSEHMKNFEKQISDLSFEFSLGVLARRTQAESTNKKSDDSPKEFIVLDVSPIVPKLFLMDQLYCDENSPVVGYPEEMETVIENPLVEAEGIQDGVAISDTTSSYPASGTDIGSFNNISSSIDDSISSSCDSSDENGTQESPARTSTVVTLTDVEDVSDGLKSTSSRQNPPIKHPLRNKSSKKIFLKKTGSGNLKKKGISGSSLAQRNYKCYFCEKVLSKLSHLDRHMRTHTHEKPFKCSVCEKTFSETSNLKKHQRIHTGEQSFKCSFCEKTFIDLYNLKRHKIIHTGERPFHCSFCAKRFNQWTNFKRHETIHTGKPFKCSFCVKTFNSAHCLKKHEKKHTK